MIFFWQANPLRHLQHFPAGDIHWLACTISTVQYLDLLPNMRLETHGPAGVMKAFWGIKDREGRWDVWDKSKHLQGHSFVTQPKKFAPFFFYTHLAMQGMVERLKQQALLTVGGVTTPEVTQEGRALQWLQASLQVLTKAVENSGQLLQAAFFIGKETPEAPWQFRAVVFNLDITAMFDEEGVLGVVVFDDKNLGAGAATTPVLEARFKALKAPVVDEFIRLSASVMENAEKRYLKSVR